MSLGVFNREGKESCKNLDVYHQLEKIGYFIILEKKIVMTRSPEEEFDTRGFQHFQSIKF